MRRKVYHWWVSLFASLLLVAGQLLVSAHACSLVGPDASTTTASSEMHCQDMNAAHTGMGKDSVSKVCHDHCAQPSQSSQTVALDMPVYSLVALFEIPKLTTESFKVSDFSFSLHTVAFSSSPPLRIQYQTFRI